jgi:hypothetical protein
MNRWIETGFLTHGEANAAKNELLEDFPLEEGEEFDIDCYAIGQGQYKYGVKIVQKDDAK